MRKVIFTILIACILLPFAAAQETSDDNRGNGLAVTLDMGVDAFNFTSWNYGSSDIRGRAYQNHSEIQYLISNWNFAKDAKASLEYGGKYFGGSFAFQPQIVSGSWTFGAKMKGWARFAFLRVTLGNDIETNYADWQGSEDGLLLYTGAGWENADNITNSNGLLLEAFPKPFTFAAAAGDFLSKWDNTERITNNPNDDNIYKDRYNTSLSYGARAGYEFGGPGKINASYKIYYNSIANNFRVPGGNFSDLVATKADAEVFRHVFGLYGSFYFGDLGLTAGYLGHATVYLPEYFSTQSSIRNMVKTAMPVIYKNGIALNLKWKASDYMTLRMENSFTFWQDKNYDIFGISGGDWNLNVATKEKADDYSLIDHIALRNGIGLGYFFTDRIEGKVFLQNILTCWNASGLTPADEKYTYTLAENMSRIELGLNYYFNANAVVYIKMDVSNTITDRSRDLNAATPSYFVEHVHNEKPEMVPTIDNKFVVRIPIGFTLNMR